MTARLVFNEPINSVPNGRTGLTAIPAGALLIGNGTGALQTFSTTAGRVLVGNGASGVTDDAGLLFDSTNDALTAVIKWDTGGASPVYAHDLVYANADVKKMNGAAIIGDGTVGNSWRGTGVSP